MDLSPFSKAIAGGIVSSLVAVLSHYGFQPHAETVTALGVLVSAVVGYALGHLVVYLSPANKHKFRS